MEMHIGHLKVGPSHPPCIVAELSGNHLGSLKRALQIVESAYQAGVHALKLQTFTPDTLTLNVDSEEFFIRDENSLWKDRKLYDLYQESFTPWEWHQEIFDRCHALGMEVFCSPFDETAVDFLETLHVPCYKIASPEIIDHDLIRKVAQTGKPMIISTGAATLTEIGEAVAIARASGCQELLLLKCTAAYPASPRDAHLRTLPHLADSFGTLVGLSDHTLGIGVAIASIPFGACLIEKHFTLSRSDGGVDSAFSLEPNEFRSLVNESKIAWEALGEIKYGRMDSERVTHSHRPSLYFIVDLAKGTVVRPDHIRSVRARKGLPPKELHRLVGLKLTENVKMGTPVSWEHFKS